MSSLKVMAFIITNSHRYFLRANKYNFSTHHLSPPDQQYQLPIHLALTHQLSAAYIQACKHLLPQGVFDIQKPVLQAAYVLGFTHCSQESAR